MKRLTAFVLMGCGCNPSGTVDHDFGARFASDVPFEVPAITVGDSVVVDVGPLFWDASSLRFKASSSDTTVVRARMDREWGQALTIHGLAPGSARVSLTPTDLVGYTDPPYGHGGRSTTRTTTVEVVEAGG